MKRSLFFCVLAILATAVRAQNIQLSLDTVNLGVVYENQPDSALIFVKNTSPTWQGFAVERIAEFPVYGDTVVTLNFTNKLVYPGDSLAVWVVAKPEHNIKHKGSILLDAGLGFGQIAIPFKFQGRYSKTYYTATENKVEAILRTQLKSTISAGYTQLSYSAARDEMYSDLDNVNGDVTCVYTGRTATFNSRAGANANSFNCEHTFPQGFFNSNLPMRSDIHHLFSTDVTANSQRGSLPFGVVTNPSWQNGGSKKSSSRFEPRNVQKGATARAMMYFVLRYQDYSNHFSGQETILRQWHSQYPPQQAEQDRNDGIYQLQNNRNPFVDYPQFAERITNLIGGTAAPMQPAVFFFDTVALDYQTTVLTPQTTTLYIYNSGNQTLGLTNFQLSGALTFAAGSGTPTSIAPGVSEPVQIQYLPSTDFTGETLTFLWSTPSGMQNETVYFNSITPSFDVDENSFQKAIKVLPNQISWSSHAQPFNWMVLDISGRKMAEGASQKQSSFSFQNLKPGVYIFRAWSATGQFTTRFIVTNY